MVRPRPCSSLVDPEQSVFPPLVKYKTRAGKYTQHSTAKAKEKLLASLKSREVRETGRVRGIRGIGSDSDGDSGLWIGMGMELRIGREKTYLKRWRVICSPLNKRFQNAIYNENQKAESKEKR